MKALLPILLLATISGDAAPPTLSRWTPDPLSTAGYEATPTFSADGREMIYLSADSDFRRWRLLRSTCVDGTWTTPAPPPFAAPGEVVEADPGFTPDGRGLFFVSARQDHANEDFDIYHVARAPNGTWGKAVRLPEPVNSAQSELLPRIDLAGRLYFGSARAGGRGGSDIYVATRTADGGWSVSNLGEPVNSSANEYEADISRDGQTLIVVSDRAGRSHLYRFRRSSEGWVEVGRLPARDDVFQVGPILSPAGERLLFSQADGPLSGEIFLADLTPGSREPWPPACRP